MENNSTNENDISVLTSSHSSLLPSDDELAEYYFESDPLALQNDSDYQKLIRCLVKLEADKVQAVKDLEHIQDVKEQCMKDPIKFVDDLLNGHYQNMPGPIKLDPLPNIDMDQYEIDDFINGVKSKTRKRKGGDLDSDSSCDEKDEKKGKMYVRGREYTDTKPSTFNQPWSEEEQRRLDELLIKYPDERIASQRYSKIAKDLGTRTPVQVQSRVQKYFVLLKREGFPVPGRSPRRSGLRKAGRRRMYSNTSYLDFSKGSNFIDSFNYNCNESSLTDNQSLKANYTDYNLPNVADEEDISSELRNTEEYKEIIRKRRIKLLKIEESTSGIIKHPGFSCDLCFQNPIIGTRWHCEECPQENSVDFCNKCVKTNHSNSTHLPTHSLKPIKALCIKDTLLWLRDYMS